MTPARDELTAAAGLFAWNLICSIGLELWSGRDMQGGGEEDK